MDKSHKLAEFRRRLRGHRYSGLNVESLSPDYILRFKGGLVGKHFKALVQVMPIVVRDLLPQPVVHAWLLMSQLVLLLWHTEIDDLEPFLVSIRYNAYI